MNLFKVMVRVRVILGYEISFQCMQRYESMFNKKVNLDHPTGLASHMCIFDSDVTITLCLNPQHKNNTLNLRTLTLPMNFKLTQKTQMHNANMVINLLFII